MDVEGKPSTVVEGKREACMYVHTYIHSTYIHTTSSEIEAAEKGKRGEGGGRGEGIMYGESNPHSYEMKK